MNKANINLQDMFLNYVRREKVPVTINLINGTKITGTIKGFDNFVIFLRHSAEELIYKHAISTIQPQVETGQFRDVVNKD
ncbi:MAG: RNA chaperone Hfq [Nitrospirota bacterium]